MAIETIPTGYAGAIELRDFEVLDVLLRERSLTRAAKVLEVTQPALSKTLARLRRYFSDPLLVRAGLRMEPTAKALELGQPVGGILERVRALRSAHVAFDPATSSRTFNFCVVDAGVIKLLPPLVNHLLANAPRVRVRTVALDAQQLEPWLASGNIDFAMGSFPALTKAVRRQLLWTENYVSVVRNGHPRLGRRLGRRPSAAAFAGEKHVLVSTVGTGHAHQLAERAIERAVAPENIVCRVPMFIGAAVLAKHTDAVATLPRSIATVLARDLDLAIIRPPLRLPEIGIYQYWHTRFHREPGSQWIRAVFASLFGDR
ncbi:MAG TPA: LysR family transcriptional regulator [Xanthobacteraceae bacterium]|jgi:DNA-binding transcriptional LysR family regulator|nr:LysR family transcriptional regulator [Xanthobacteraceae bacterium]